MDLHAICYYSGLVPGPTVTLKQFQASLSAREPASSMSAPLAALWWESKGDWVRAHGLVDELETVDGMAVHAYLHRKEGNAPNAEYWYARAGRKHYRPELDAEWAALVDH